MFSDEEVNIDQFVGKSKNTSIVLMRGKPYKKQVLLADVNIPYKLSLDRSTNKLFFCINADDFSDQSFHSVVLNIDSGTASVIPGVRNGFASAVDNITSTGYLGGSDGIYKFDYSINDVQKPPLVPDIDIFDMYFYNSLYYVDTAGQNLYLLRDGKKSMISEVKDCLIHHFAFDRNKNLIFVNSTGLYILPKGAKSPVRIENVSRDLNFRGIAVDIDGRPHFMTQDGIYTLDTRSDLLKLLQVENGYGLAFDKENNIIYSDQRTVNKLTPVKIVSQPSTV